MTLNIQFQISGLILVIVVMCLYFSKKSLRLFTERIYSKLLIAVSACLTMDILSVFCINLKGELPSALVGAVCRGYLFSISVVSCILLEYTLLDINRKYRGIKNKLLAFKIPLIISAFGCLFLPIHYYVDSKKLYSYGESVVCIYAVCVFYLCACFYYTCKYENKMNRSRRSAVLFLLFGWVITALIQFIRNEWLLVGFAMALAMVYMYLCLENPDENIDKLTGVLNRRALEICLKNYFEEEKDFRILDVSIDNLKRINEIFGLKNGNQLIIELAAYFADLSEGMVFRSGGGEFSLVFLEDEKCSRATEAIQERFRGAWRITDADIAITIHIVEVQGREFAGTAEELIELMKYFVLEAGRRGDAGYIRIGQEQIEGRARRKRVETALRKAMEEETVQVYYQPIYSVEHKKYLSAEALVRIRDADGNFVSPELFIPIAEQNGLILKLGMIVFEKVCSFISSHRIWEYGIRFVEINLSVIQCMQENLASELMVVMKKYRVPADFINLELTETAAVNSENTLYRNMETLIGRGVSFSLDDYGSGYSNLSYIVSLPFSIIKLDKSLVWSYFKTEKARIVMESAIAMIKHLGMKIVVEGVETEKQLRMMERLDIDFIQGYYFSRPLEPEGFLRELTKD